MPLWLPLFDRFYGVDEHENIEGKIIAYPKETAQLKNYNNGNTYPYFSQSRNYKPNNYHPYITHRIENTITYIPLSNRRFTITVDNNGRILQEFPSSFEDKCEEEAIPQGKLAPDEPKKSIKQNTVDNMRKRIGIRNSLRIFTPPYVTIPPSKSTIRTKNGATSVILHARHNNKYDNTTPNIKRVFSEKDNKRHNHEFK